MDSYKGEQVEEWRTTLSKEKRGPWKDTRVNGEVQEREEKGRESRS